MTPAFRRLVLLITLVLIAPVGCVRRDEGFTYRGGRLTDRTNYDVFWHHGEVEYIVFCPSEVLLKAGPLVSDLCSWRGQTPSSKGISLLPEGLFLDGALVNTAGPNKVFVMQADGTLRAIRIVQKDLDNLSRSRIAALEQSDSWAYLRAEFQVP